MKINFIKINGFGKLRNKEIRLKNNINLIYGKNESGKSTILKFILGIMFGISKNKNGKSFSDFEYYLPWDNENFSGKMEYELDNKERFEVFREFNKKNPNIYNEEKQDISKNFSIDKNKGNNYIFEQINLDEETILSTSIIEQKNVILNEKKESNLLQKITNMVSTGEENVSFKKTIDKLNKKLVEEIGNDRTTGRPINIIEEALEKLELEKKELINYEQEKGEIDKINKQNQEKLKKKNSKILLIKEIKKFKEEIALQEEKININNEIIKNCKQEINKEKNAEENKTINKWLLIASLVILLISLVFFKSNLVKIFTIILIIVSNIIYILNIKNKNKKIRERNILYENGVKLINDNITKKEIEIEDLKNSNLKKKKDFFGYLIKRYLLINEGEIKKILNSSTDEINNLYEEEQENLNKLKVEINSINLEIDKIENKLEEKPKIIAKIIELEDRKKELLDLKEAIILAKQVLETSYDKMKKEITPRFTKSLSEIINKISDGKYKNVRFIEKEGLIVELENGKYINSNKLSIGTIDQLYLSLRLSLIEEITKEKVPIILDEAFAYYDDERLENILNYIYNEYNDRQIIILTCTQREKEAMQKRNIEYNFIEI